MTTKAADAADAALSAVAAGWRVLGIRFIMGSLRQCWGEGLLGECYLEVEAVVPLGLPSSRAHLVDSGFACCRSLGVASCIVEHARVPVTGHCDGRNDFICRSILACLPC